MLPWHNGHTSPLMEMLTEASDNVYQLTRTLHVVES